MNGQVFSARVLMLLVFSVLIWIVGMGMAYAAGVTEPVFPPYTSLLVLASAVFAFGFLFFGFGTPIMMFFIGLYTGSMLGPEVTPYLVALITSSLLACYSSIRLGDALLEDLRGKGNFKSALAISLIIFAFALAIALVIDIASFMPF